MTAHRRIRASWTAILFTSLMGVAVIVLLSGCARDPASTPKDVTPPATAPTQTDIAVPSATATATPAPSDLVSTPKDETTPEATATAATGESPGDVATPTLMDIVAADTRHFKGDPRAPVTIVEFGDFQ